MSTIDKRIKIYTGDVTELEDETLYNEIYSSVSDDRRARTDRKRQIADKRRSLAAERLLMKACADFGIDYGSARFCVSESGKPGFADIPVFFNLSHSVNRAMCVMSDCQAGCDVEQIHSVNADIALRFYHPDEAALLDSCGTAEEREQLFFRLWTLKESFVKCIGTGFDMPFGSFCVFKAGEEWNVRGQNIKGNYYFSEFSNDDEYCYSWCIRK